jgi:hypothetical protein
MPLTNGSGSGFGSCCFRHWPSRCQQKTNKKKILLITFWRFLHLHHFSKIKSQKESQNSRNPGFSYYFCLRIEGSGSIPLTNGSGSVRAKNMWIRWIRIRNTACISASVLRGIRRYFSGDPDTNHGSVFESYQDILLCLPSVIRNYSSESGSRSYHPTLLFHHEDFLKFLEI